MQNHNLLKYIHVFENVVSDELCDKIIKEYCNDSNWEKTVTLSGLDINTRNCSYINIISENKKRKKIDNKIFNSVDKIVSKLKELYPDLTIDQDTGYVLLRYNEGEFYKEHTDSHRTVPRDISCSIILNDDYEGGEFAFFGGSEKYKLKKGSAITFPSNFMFPHQILPVKRGTRYSIITWFN